MMNICVFVYFISFESVSGRVCAFSRRFTRSAEGGFGGMCVQ